MNFTNDELVTILSALNTYAVGSVNKAAYNWQVADIDYVLTGGASNPVGKAKALIERFAAQLETQKAEQCEPAKT